MPLHHTPARLFKIGAQPAGQHCRKFRIDQVIRAFYVLRIPERKRDQLNGHCPAQDERQKGQPGWCLLLRLQGCFPGW